MATGRLVLGAPGSGAGKTTVTLALLAALRRRGWPVQGFKVGPDFIDPAFHTAVTGIPCRNLDVFLAGPEEVRATVAQAAAHQCTAVVEGVMGLYDGVEAGSDGGSTAHIARVIAAPVVLVLDVSAMARTAAALVYGLQHFPEAPPISGVILNRVGSREHYAMVAEAITTACGLPCFGYLPQASALTLPERHLGLVTAVESGDLQPLFDRLAEQAEATMDIDALLGLAATAPEVKSEPLTLAAPRRQRPTVVAVAWDAAFQFYYPENLKLLEQLGARVARFSPLGGDPIPSDAIAAYFGGGFPELHGARWRELAGMLREYRQRVRDGLGTVAECGGLVFLGEFLVEGGGGLTPLVGAVPGGAEMTEHLQGIGYRTVTVCRDGVFPGGSQFLGHEFHYSRRSVPSSPGEAACVLESSRGSRYDGHATSHLFASYAHLYFPSNVDAVQYWLDRARDS